MGQFVRADTVLTNAMGMDGYAYVGDSPIGRNDPTGHCPFCIGFIVGAVIGAAVAYGTQVYNNYQNGVPNPWTQNIDVTSIVAGALTGAVIGGSLGVGIAAGGALLAGGASITTTIQATTWVTGMDLAYGTGEIIKAESEDAQLDEDATLNQIERAQEKARGNLKLTGGRDPRAAGAIAQTDGPEGPLEVSGVSGPWRSDHYYGTGTCAEFNCAINSRIWASNIDASDRSDINLYIWQVNGRAPCLVCQNTLQRWTNWWGAPINAYWLDENGIFNTDTYLPDSNAGLDNEGPGMRHGW